MVREKKYSITLFKGENKWNFVKHPIEISLFRERPAIPKGKEKDAKQRGIDFLLGKMVDSKLHLDNLDVDIDCIATAYFYQGQFVVGGMDDAKTPRSNVKDFEKDIEKYFYNKISFNDFVGMIKKSGLPKQYSEAIREIF